MIDKITISNFKSIDGIELEARGLNILAGTNSSGKSSTIQALLLVSQNLDNAYGLNGPLVSVGDFREAKNYNINKQSIAIIVHGKGEEVCISFQEDENISYKNPDCELAGRLRYDNNKFHYLSCHRIGPQDIFYKNRTVNKGVGINGEYTMDFLYNNRDNPLEESLVKDKTNYTLLAQTNYWLKYIIGANISTEEISGTDAVKARYGIVDGIFSRPQNVGSGISYLVSIIVMCLGSEKEDILIIENPEIHLHPLSQSRLCEFLYYISNAGRQLFVETHSDHIFNAIRVGIANSTMDLKNITIHFFRLGSDHCTRDYRIEIGAYGKIENPIPNLFDQFQMDLDKMLGV